MGDYLSNLPDRCPEGHPLAGPRQSHTSWSMEHRAHRLYCTACNDRSRILLRDGERWEVYIGGRWVMYEG
jgi:hypothetical protein